MADSDWEDIDPKKVNHDSQWEDLPNFESAISPGLSSAASGHFLNGMAMGGSSKISGAMKNPMGALKAAQQYTGYLPFIGAPAENSDSDVKEYLKAKFNKQNELSKSREKYPVASNAAELGGGLVTGTAFPASTLPKAFAMGGAAGLIHSNASTPEEAGSDLAKGAVIGGGAYGALSYAGNKIGNLMSGKTAEDLAVRHLRPTASVSRALGRDKLRDIGRESLDSGAISFGNKAEDTAAALSDLTNEAGAVKGDIVNASKATISPKDIADNFDLQVIESLRGTSENKELVRQLEEKRDAFLQQYAPARPQIQSQPQAMAQAVGESQPQSFSINQTMPEPTMTPAQLEAEKMAVQNNLNYKVDPNSKLEANRGWARVLKEGSEDAINDPAFNASKRAFGNLKSANLMSDRTAALADSGNGLLGHLTDVGVGTEALHEIANGNPAGIALGAARGLTKGRVSSSLSVMANQPYKAGQAVQKVLDSSSIVQRLSGNPAAKKFAGVIQAAASRGASSLAATHFILQQTEPEYQKAVQGE